MQDAPKAVWSIPYVSVTFFPCLKQNFIAYRSSKVSDCIFELHQLWQSGFSRVYSKSCSRCSFKPEIIKIGHSSHKMYSNNIVSFQESTAILNACTKKSLETYRMPLVAVSLHISMTFIFWWQEWKIYNYTFLKSITTIWNPDDLGYDLNAGRRVHFQRQYSLLHHCKVLACRLPITACKVSSFSVHVGKYFNVYCYIIRHRLQNFMKLYREEKFISRNPISISIHPLQLKGFVLSVIKVIKFYTHLPKRSKTVTIWSF